MTVPRDDQTTGQRCDVILDRDGGLRIVLAGDWLAPSERWVIEQVLSDVRALEVPVELDTDALRRASPEISAMVQAFGAPAAI